jgi:hypothetical protein
VRSTRFDPRSIEAWAHDPTAMYWTVPLKFFHFLGNSVWAASDVRLIPQVPMSSHARKTGLLSAAPASACGRPPSRTTRPAAAWRIRHPRAVTSRARRRSAPSIPTAATRGGTQPVPPRRRSTAVPRPPTTSTRTGTPRLTSAPRAAEAVERAAVIATTTDNPTRFATARPARVHRSVQRAASGSSNPNRTGPSAARAH